MKLSPESDAGASTLCGRVFGHSYELEKVVGVGGMGRVYRANQRLLRRKVAVKVIHPNLLEDEETVKRFYVEARAASRLNHPNSVSIFDFGRTEDGLLYLVMEFLRGRDLARVMREDGPLGLARVVELTRGILAALGEAHDQGVVHCDLKPENIIVEPLSSGADLVKVVDFGLAKLRGAEPVGSGASGLVSGTPDYMSPEQARADDVDGRGDLYALGVVLFEMLTGRLPFVGRTAAEVMTAHVRAQPPEVLEVAPERGIPEALARVVRRALAKSPDDRYARAEEMAGALAAALPRPPPLPDAIVVCGGCFAKCEAGRNFCADCGLALESSRTGTSAVRTSVPVGVFVGRDHELDQLGAWREAERKGVASAYVYGPPGVGKSSLLARFAAQAKRAGDLVVQVGAHPSAVALAYGTVRDLIGQLFGVSEADLHHTLQDSAVAPSLWAEAGVSELLSPVGLPGLPGESRHHAVAALLARALEDAAFVSVSSRVLLILDDLDEADDLSSRVLSVLPQFVQGRSILCVMAGQAPWWLERELPGLCLSLAGLPRALLARFLPDEIEVPELPRGGVLPLYVEQLAALEWKPRTPSEAVPELSDVIARRMDELEPAARRLLQMIAVLGVRVERESLCALGADDELKGLPALLSAALVREEGDMLNVVHPFVRELIHLSTPAEMRRALHQRALECAGSRGLPLEVRVEHAFRAEERMTSLMLLERSGADAGQRGDRRMQVRAFQRGLELARRELLETGEPELERAIATFSRALGEALLHSGDTAQAAGVVRESIDLSAGDPELRCSLLCLLSEVAAARCRMSEAEELYAEVRALAERAERKDLLTQVHLLRARLCTAAGDTAGTSQALATVWWRVTTAGARPREQLAVGLEYAEALLGVGEPERAAECARKLVALARAAQGYALSARALGLLAGVAELQGDTAAARAHYDEAIEEASRAGDVVRTRVWEQALKAMEED